MWTHTRIRVLISSKGEERLVRTLSSQAACTARFFNPSAYTRRGAHSSTAATTIVIHSCEYALSTVLKVHIPTRMYPSTRYMHAQVLTAAVDHDIWNCGNVRLTFCINDEYTSIDTSPEFPFVKRLTVENGRIDNNRSLSPLMDEAASTFECHSLIVAHITNLVWRNARPAYRKLKL